MQQSHILYFLWAIKIYYQTPPEFSLPGESLILAYAVGCCGLLRGLSSTVNPHSPSRLGVLP